MHQSDQDIRNRLLIARLPAMPQILVKLIEHLQADDLGMPELAALIAKDAGMTGKLLAVANSSAYHRHTRSADLEQSLVALGTDMIKTLVISDSVFQTFNSFPHSNSIDLRAFWKYSLSAAVLARDAARALGYAHPEEAYLAGLLHNVGRLALLAAAPKEYGFNFTARDDDDLCAVEQRTLQITHTEAGAWLIERWQLDSFLADAVLYHHEPSERLESSHPLIRIVRLAHVLSHHADDETMVVDACALCGIDAAQAAQLVGHAARQVEQAAAHLGIDLGGADDIPSPPAYAPPAPVDPVQQRLNEEVRNMVLVSEVGQSLARQQGESGLLDAMTRTARILFDFDSAVVLLENPTGQLLSGAPTFGAQRIAEFTLPLSKGGPVARSALERRPAFVQRDRQRDQLGLAEEQLLRMLGTDSLVVVPLVAGPRCLGVLVGGVPGWQLPHCQRRERFMQAFGAQAASALENLLLERGHARRQLASVTEEFRDASRRVIHEVNNPLAIIKNYLSVLDGKLARQEPVGGELSILNEEIDRVGQLIGSLADQRTPDAVPRPLDAAKVVDDVLRLFRGSGYVPATTQVVARMEGDGAIEGDPDVLKQILVNLVKNAVEALGSRPAGRIEIVNRGHVNRERQVYLELVVSDNGPGLSREVLANLFSPVRSAKGGADANRGLGLSIVHGLVKQLDGHIACRSGSAGTSFEILLPAWSGAGAVRRRRGARASGARPRFRLTFTMHAHPATATMLPGEPAPFSQTLETDSQPRLLLVDDEPRLLSSLYELLQGRGYRLTTAPSGSDALAHLSRQHFDLVLLDLRLPDIGGHEIMDFINEKSIDADVIVMSGEIGIDAAIGALKRGAYSYLRKPYSREELLSTVSNALQRRRLTLDNARIANQLENSEKMYRYLVDSSPDIIYTLNHEGRFTFVNDRAYQLLGYTREELIGQHYSILVHEEDLERARYVFNERRVDERASRNVELRLKCRGGGNGLERHDRTFNTTLMTISLNAIGMHVPDQEVKKLEFFGTYGVARDITDRKRAEEVISYQAYHDILTDLPNRILFKDRLGLAVIQAKRKQTELAVMFIDLDRFKLVNDTLGHVKGDELLQQAAGRLKECLRKGDTLARQGGDEFTIVLPELRDRDDARMVADKFLECLQEPFDLDGHEVHISASIGIAIYPKDGESIDELLRHADIAMYQVKALGKNGHSFYHDSMLEVSHQKIALEQSLRRALEHDELEMFYQPQIDAMTGRITGAEALMRWNHPTRGRLSAGEFLPFAEENGLMLPISDWMIGALCRDMLQWNAIGGSDIRLSLNLSPQYLDRGDFFEKMRGALARYGISPQQIEVEITENICIRNPQYAIEQLNKLCQLGVSIAIDDFGTGYSSLSYLHRFPIHTVKIDQSFVKEIHQEDGHYPVILAIISIARGLGLNLIAEGVETEEQARYLRANGCLTMQGYLFYRPISLHDFMAALRTQSASTPRVVQA